MIDESHRVQYCASYVWFMENKNKTMDENYFYPSKEHYLKQKEILREVSTMKFFFILFPFSFFFKVFILLLYNILIFFISLFFFFFTRGCLGFHNTHFIVHMFKIRISWWWIRIRWKLILSLGFARVAPDIWPFYIRYPAWINCFK